MLEVAIRFSATLSDNHVKAGTLTRKGEKKGTDKAPAETKEAKIEPSSSRKKKRKFNNQNYAITTPVAPPVIAPPAIANQPPRKPYTGTFPLCNRCNYHHPTTAACRQCTACGRNGHTVNFCRGAGRPQAVQPLAAQPMLPPANPRA